MLMAYFFFCILHIPVRNSLRRTPVSIPASPKKETFSWSVGDVFLGLCHCIRPLSNMFWRDTVMSKVLPSVVTASAIAWVTSSRLKRGERKGKELLCIREIFHSGLKSMTSGRCYDPHLGTDRRAGYDAGYYF